jgi:hypothetical protein
MTPRHVRLAVTAVAAAALLLVAAPSASAARDCQPPDYPGSGYFTSLSVKGTTCAKGKKLARAYYRCRTDAGGRRGRCNRRVMRYSCSETRQSIATEFNARVRCKRGSKRIMHTYQQNL